MKKHIVLFTLATFLTTASTFAQGEFLRPGENAIGFAGVKTFGDNAAGIGGTLGVGINGCFDIAVAFSHNTDLEINTFSPSLTYYFKENKPKSVVGLGLTAGYAHSETSGGRTVGGDALLGGLTIFGTYREQNKIAFQVLATGALSYALGEDFPDRTALTVSAEIRWLFAPEAPFRPFVGAGYGYSEQSELHVGSVMAGFVIVLPRQ